jgi:hypothetical protein
MSQRTVFILLAALVVLIGLATLGRDPGSAPPMAGQTFLPNLSGALAEAERVTVVKANGETVATLEKRPERWVVADKHDYAADVAKLSQALATLGEAKILEQKTANPALYDRLGVQDVTGADAAGLGITVAAGDREIANVVLGNAEGARYRYARRGGEAESYLIDKNPDFPRTAAQWLDSEIVDIRGDRVKEVTITHADGEVVRISKASPELTNYDVADVPSGRELLYPGVANVIGNGLRELSLEDVEPAGAAAESPTVVEYRTFDGLIVRVTGVKTDEASWISLEARAEPTENAPAPAADGAASPDPAAEADRINAQVGAWRYKIASFQYDQMTRRMSDLLKPPPAA